MLQIQIFFILLFRAALECNADIIKRLQFPIGGLFNTQTDRGSLKAFQNIMKRTPTYLGGPIVPDVTDTYSTALFVCRNTTENGIIALIDARPTFGDCDTTCLLCNRLQIPYLSVGWQSPETLDEDVFSFSYHPSPEMTSRAFAALIRDLHDSSGFDKFTVLYEDDDSFIRIQEVINTWPYEREAILYRKLYPDRDNRETFKYIFKVAHMSHHVLDCSLNNIKKYMNEIVQVENSTHYQSFILTNLDAYTLRFDDIPELRANVSTLHLTTDSSIVRWKDYDMVTGNTIRVETALTADAMNHLEMAIRYMLDATEDITKDMFSPPPPLCFEDNRAAYDDVAWPAGKQLWDALLNAKINGFTGNVEFDRETRKRTNLIMYFSKLNNQSVFENAGFWNSSTNTITTNNNIRDRSTFRPSDSTIKVVTITSEPYYFKKTENGTEGEDYVGYAVDLIDAIFQHINHNKSRDYKYEMYLAPGDKYGNPVEGSKKWDGLIGEIMTHSAELGICDLTITSERNEVVDFSNPFMSLGISMLFKDPDPVPPDMFSFIKPLAIDVWLYLCTSYILVSVILLICARMSQGDWVNPHPCNQNPENWQNIWTLYNCMWLMMGSIMTQGCDILPRAASSRWVTGVWWFFAMIITATYMANMSTFLSDSRRNNFISDVKSLSEQTKVSYGAVYNASTYRFFQNSEDVIYSKIWTTMDSARPSVFTKDNKEGIERVIKTKGGKYAFFMESTAIDYYTQRHCELRKVGQRLDSKDYGIAVPKNSQLKGLVDTAIIHLQETGRLEALKTKWWEEGIKKCENPEEDTSGSLQMMNTSGIFLVLGVGGFLGLIVAVIDFMMHAFKVSVKERIEFREALASEWRASLDPRSLQKPAAPPRSAPPSPERDRSQSRAVSVLRAATSLVNFDNIY